MRRQHLIDLTESSSHNQNQAKAIYTTTVLEPFSLPPSLLPRSLPAILPPPPPAPTLISLTLASPSVNWVPMSTRHLKPITTDRQVDEEFDRQTQEPTTRHNSYETMPAAYPFPSPLSLLPSPFSLLPSPFSPLPFPFSLLPSPLLISYFDQQNIY